MSVLALSDILMVLSITVSLSRRKVVVILHRIARTCITVNYVVSILSRWCRNADIYRFFKISVFAQLILLYCY